MPPPSKVEGSCTTSVANSPAAGVALGGNVQGRELLRMSRCFSTANAGSACSSERRLSVLYPLRGPLAAF